MIVRVEFLGGDRTQQTPNDGKIERNELAQRGGAYEVIYIRHKIKFATKRARSAQAQLADASKNPESRRVPFVLAESLHPVVDVTGVELDSGIEVAHSRPPVAQDLFQRVRILVG